MPPRRGPRYATGGQALTAQQQLLTAAARLGIRHPVAHGTEISITTASADSTDVQWVTASAVRGRLLVTLNVRNYTGQRSVAGVEPQVVTQTPLIRDVLADNASRIDEMSFPWWG